MNSRFALVFGIIVVVVTASAATSLIPIHKVNAHVIPDLGRAGFPPNPNAEVCGRAGKFLPIPFC